MKDKKILLVTGASSDVGCELIRQIHGNYERIYAHYQHENDGFNELGRILGDKFIPIRADFSDAQSVKEMIASIAENGEGVDHIVHLSAPKLKTLQLRKTDWSGFEEGIHISIRSIYEICKAFLPGMAQRRYGKVIFMLSSCTLNMPPKYETDYVTVKYALLGLMKSLSVEYADKGITVNGVSPDMIETKFLKYVQELIVQKNATNSPLGRNLNVRDVVPAFQYLLSDGADTVTGQNFGVTGGVQ